jgi:hypothetical protein
MLRGIRATRAVVGIDTLIVALSSSTFMLAPAKTDTLATSSL